MSKEKRGYMITYHQTYQKSSVKRCHVANSSSSDRNIMSDLKQGTSAIKIEQ